MTRVTVVSQAVIDLDASLGPDELARACGADLHWVRELVSCGVLAERPGDPSGWRFASADLSRARRARRLQRDFDLELEAAALMLDLMDEVQRLRRRLRAFGLDAG
ncbi:MAG: MerR family transcriptional regulator [Burkholderiales bacterium]|nr:MAG: MerR family transcriptional regulator [Burkholderiales bacterium]